MLSSVLVSLISLLFFFFFLAAIVFSCIILVILVLGPLFLFGALLGTALEDKNARIDNKR